MKQACKITLAGAVAAMTLSAASTALASYQPKLTASMTSGGTTLSVSEGILDAPTAVLTIYASRGISATLGAPGHTIGAVQGIAAPVDYGGLPLALTGTIVSRRAGDTYLVAGVPTQISQAASQCTGTAAHAAYWIMRIGTADTTFDVPAFVDPAAGSDAKFASYKIAVCLSPPDVPFGTPGRAPAGAKITTLSLVLRSGLLHAGGGEQRWRAVATPYAPASGTQDKTGAVETQSINAGPVAMTVSGHAINSTQAAITGSVMQGGHPVADAPVAIMQSGKVVVTATTDAAGAFAAKTALHAPVTGFTATTTSGAQGLDASKCTATFAPIPCIAITQGGYTASSKAIQVRRDK